MFRSQLPCLLAQRPSLWRFLPGGCWGGCLASAPRLDPGLALSFCHNNLSQIKVSLYMSFDRYIPQACLYNPTIPAPSRLPSARVHLTSLLTYLMSCRGRACPEHKPVVIWPTVFQRCRIDTTTCRPTTGHPLGRLLYVPLLCLYVRTIATAANLQVKRTAGCLFWK